MTDPKVVIWTSLKGLVQRFFTRVMVKWREEDKLWGIPPLKLREEWLLIRKICYQIVSTVAVKNG